MILTEVKQDLFDLDSSYHLVHCISADCAMGAGIAVEFNKRFPQMKNVIKIRHRGVCSCCMFSEVSPDHRIRHVFNLITKPLFWHKPSYDTLTSSLVDLQKQCLEFGVLKLGMPRIGSGLDKLEWSNVRGIIESIFENMNIEIIVCYIE